LALKVTVTVVDEELTILKLDLSSAVFPDASFAVTTNVYEPTPSLPKVILLSMPPDLMSYVYAFGVAVYEVIASFPEEL
jgi:hypothetical protein